MTTNNTKQAFWVALGSLISFGFSIVSSMILSRYFDKSDYGTYRQVMYVYHTLLTIFTLGLPKAYSYFLPRVSPDEAKNLINKITRLFFILGGLFSLILYLGSTLFAEILNNPKLEIALRYFSIVPFLMLPTMGIEGILSTYKETKFLAVYTITTRAVMLCCVMFPVILWNLGYIGAIIGFVIASVFSALLALYLKFHPIRNNKCLQTHISYKEIFQFSLPLLYASVWGILMNSADQFFISRYFGTEVFADFSNGSIELPFVGMIVGACSTVLSPIFSKMSHEKLDLNKTALPLWNSVYRKTALLMYPIIVYCWVFADTIMVVLYGEKYDTSHIYFRIKVLTYIFSLIVFAPFLINSGKVKFYSNVTAIFAIIIWPIEYISLMLTNSPFSVPIVSLVLHVAKIFVFLYVIANMFGVKLHELFPIKLIWQIIIPSFLIMYVLQWGLNILNVHTPLIILIVSFFTYGVLFFIYCSIIKIDYFSLIKPLLIKNEKNNKGNSK